MMIPYMTTLDNWAASLIVDFPNDNIPFLEDKENWKEWGNFLVQETSFSDNGAPRTNHFSDWKTWAYAVFRTMANF